MPEVERPEDNQAIREAKRTGAYTKQWDAMVGQKNVILSRLNKSEYGDELMEVVDMLRMVAPLWEALNYGYKVQEINEKIKVAITTAIKSNEEQASHKENRNRPAYQRRLVAEIERLERLLASL